MIVRVPTADVAILAKYIAIHQPNSFFVIWKIALKKNKGIIKFSKEDKGEVKPEEKRKLRIKTQSKKKEQAETKMKRKLRPRLR